MATKTEQYISEPIIKKDDSLISKIEATYNVLMQKMKPKFNFTVKFYSLTAEDPNNSIDPSKLDGYNENEIDSKMTITYMEEFPVSSTLTVSGDHFIEISKSADEFVSLFKKVYKDVIGEELPWKFEKQRELFAVEVGFRKFRYSIALDFTGK